MSNSYRDLIVWQKAVALSLKVYRVTEGFPKHELYGLSNQLRRASVSVACNLGQGRNSPAEFHHFLGMAKGSLLELETQLFISNALGYASSKMHEELGKDSSEVSRLLNGLMKAVHSKKVSSAAALGTRNQKLATT